MQRRWNVFLLLITILMTTCEPYLEKSSKHSTKIYLLFAEISYNSYFRKYHKIRYQWFQRRHSLWGSTSGNLEAASQRLLQKETLPQFFFEFGKCFRVDIKNKSWWIAQKILSKKVEQVLQRRSGGIEVVIELKKKRKWTITKILL